jgi:hypothetical protein
MARLQVRRGNQADLPVTGLLTGEPLFSLDRGTLHIAFDETTPMPITPAVDLLTTMSEAIVPEDDFIMITDASAAGQKERKVTIDALSAALTASVDGGTFV